MIVNPSTRRIGVGALLACLIAGTHISQRPAVTLSGPPAETALAPAAPRSQSSISSPRASAQSAKPLSEAPAGLSEALSQARQQIWPLSEKERLLPQNGSVRGFTSNPKNRLTARFSEDGVTLAPATIETSWQAQMRSPVVSDATLKIEKNRAEYVGTNGVTEWFQNTPEGVEHGLTLQQRPFQSGGRDYHIVTLPVSLTGVRAMADRSVRIWFRRGV